MRFALLSPWVDFIAHGGIVMAKPLLPDALWEIIQPLLPPQKPRRFRYPGRKPIGDRAYDSEKHRQALRQRGIDPELARRNTEHGSGLGVYRWVVERFFSWLHGFRKLRLVTEKTQEMQFAFLNLATALICFRFL
jgi:transposase